MVHFHCLKTTNKQLKCSVYEFVQFGYTSRQLQGSQTGPCLAFDSKLQCQPNHIVEALGGGKYQNKKNNVKETNNCNKCNGVKNSTKLKHVQC